MLVFDLLFILYGVASILIAGFGVYQPRVWVEWTERQFIYRRERQIAGGVCLAIGIIPIFFLIQHAGWEVYLLSIISGIYTIIGVMFFTYYDALRKVILALAEIEDKFLRFAFLGETLFGVILLTMGLLGVFV